MKHKNGSRAFNGSRGRIWTLLIASIVTLALIVTCITFFVAPAKKTVVPVDTVEEAEASPSSTLSSLGFTGKSADIRNKVADGTIKSGTVIDLPMCATGGIVNGKWVNYSDGTYTLTLPAGKYTFELWGGEGGYGSHGARLGGPGGYAKGTLTLTDASTTVYVLVGSKGGENLTAGSTGTATNGTYQGGGFNGGGSWRGYNTDRGAGGGGATDIRIGGTTDAYRVLVAGGGGGGPYSDGVSGMGAGGGASGQDAGRNATGASWINCPMGKGGTQTAAGGCVGTPYRSSADTTGYSAGSGSTGGKASGDPDSGGGGGGGWYGGGGGHVLGGGGGSGFAYVSNWKSKYGGNSKEVTGAWTGYAVNSKYQLTNDLLQAGNESAATTNGVAGGSHAKGNRGNGFAKITVNEVNARPTAITDVTKNNISLGTSSAFSIKAYDLANDSDPTNMGTGKTKNDTLFFTDGVANALTSKATKLYLDSAMTIDASKYIDYSYSSDSQTLSISKFKILPRTNTDSNSDNQIKLYTRVRDSYCGNNGALTVNVSFTVNFKTQTITYGSSSSETADGLYTYKYGTPTTDDPQGIREGELYSSQYSATNKPLAISVADRIPTTKNGGSAGITFKAEDLVGSYDKTYYMALIVPRALGSYSSFVHYNNSDSNKVVFYDWGSATSYTQRTGYKFVTIVADNPNPAVIDLFWDVYVVEKASVAKVSSAECNNAEPPSIAYPNAASSAVVEVSFFLDNIRPELKDVNNVVKVGVNEEVTLKLSDFLEDLDETGKTITASTHTIAEVILPDEEFVYLDKYGTLVSLDGKLNAGTGFSYYNAAGAVTSDSLSSTARTNKATGFDSSIVVYNGTSAEAFMSYVYKRNTEDIPADTIVVRGLRTSYSQYSSTRAGSAAYTLGAYDGDRDAFDSGVDDGAGGYLAAEENSVLADPGHFYLLVRVVDNREVGDTGIWFPIAFVIGEENNSNATTSDPSPKPVASYSSSLYHTAQTTVPTADGDPGDTFYFTPMGLDIDGTLYPVGFYEDENGKLISTDLVPLAFDDDNYITATGTSARDGSLNELLTLTGTFDVSAFYNKIGDDGSEYINLEIIDIFIPSSYFNGRVRVGTGTVDGAKELSSDKISQTAEVGTYLDGTTDNFYKIKGLKITLRSTTMGKYIRSTVTIVDTGASSSYVDVDIAMRVSNTSPALLGNSHIASKEHTSDHQGPTYKIVTEKNVDNEDVYIPTLEFNIPLHYTVMLTPYDFIYDTDMYIESNDNNGNILSPAGGFTLNGFNGKYSGGTFTQGGSATGSEWSVKSPYVSSTYRTQDYMDALNDMLDEINKESTVGKLVDSNTAAASVTTSGKIPNDRLFFARTGSDPTADPYNYQPYKAGSTISSTFDITKSGDVDIVTIGTGTKVNIDGKVHDLDFILVRADNRTEGSIPVTIQLNVRDRFGGNATDKGMPVRIVLNIENTAPVMRDPAKSDYPDGNTAYPVKDLCCTPIYDPVDGTLEIAPASMMIEYDTLRNSIMYDYDNDVLDFVFDLGVFVANTPDLASIYLAANIDADGDGFADTLKSFNLVSTDDLFKAYREDGAGNELDKFYLSAYLTGGDHPTLNANAIGSTQNLDGGIYVYFFARDDDSHEPVLGYVRFEVLNSSPTFNSDNKTGYDVSGGKQPMWSITSSYDSDIGRARYIVGSAASETKLRSKAGVVADNPNGEDDVRLISKDVDPLQRVALAQCGTPTADGATYINLVATGLGGAYVRADYEKAVPAVYKGNNFTTVSPAAALMFYVDSEYHNITSLPAGFIEPTVDFIFYINDSWLTRTKLIDELVAGNIATNDVFDSNGRFTVLDWALEMRASSALEQVKLGIQFSLVDDFNFGGDTHGVATGHDRGVSSDNVVVSARITPTVYYEVSSTGIRTKSDYAKFGGYYTVQDQQDTSKSYISTYDGSKYSPYTEADVAATGNARDIKYSSATKQLSDTGDTTIKTVAEDAVDNTNAGTNSGGLFSLDLPANDPSLVGAFKYPSVINVPGSSSTSASDSYDTVYVPMSYFGLTQSLVIKDGGTGSISSNPQFVGYNIAEYDKGDIGSVSGVLSLTDGVRTWSGDSLNDNPYVTIQAIDFTTGKAIVDGEEVTGLTTRNTFGNDISKAYYNRALAVPTIGSDGQLAGYENASNTTNNLNNFVGNGKLMYIENQETLIKEHNFGLCFTKKNMRTGTRNLTFSIDIAKCVTEGTGADRKDKLDPSNTSKDVIRGLQVDICVENSMFDLILGTTGSDKETVLSDGTKGYYMNIDMSTSSSKTITLSRNNAAALDNEENKPFASYSGSINIKYTDRDYSSPETVTTEVNSSSVSTTYQYRDYAYFMNDSVNRVRYWNADLDAVRSASLDNVVNNERAQKSILNYYGVPDADALAALVDADNANAALKAYQANGGVYGTNPRNNGNGQEGFTSYFSVSMIASSRGMTISSTRKTYINESALQSILSNETILDSSNNRITWDPTASGNFGGLTFGQLKAVYKTRGLVVVATGNPSDDATTFSIDRVYYPLKMLIYDNCSTGGAGFNSASYVAIEFRISIKNAAPTLNTDKLLNDGKGNYYKEFTLAVNASTYFNLSDFVSDPDIYKPTATTLATRNDFLRDAKDISLETADYLESPYAYTKLNTNQQQLIDGDGGLSLASSTDTDVIMYFNTSDTTLTRNTQPNNNLIRFKVNRRTTVKDGENVKEVKSFSFTLRFTDNHGTFTGNSYTGFTEPVTFIVNVDNQAPTVATTERNIVMRAGQTFVLLTSYYDSFIGGGTGSDAYNNSLTKSLLDQNRVQGVGNLPDDWGTFSDHTAAADKNRFIRNSTLSNVPTDQKNLGYIGVASDDTPWKLRFDRTEYNASGNYISVKDANTMLVEDNSGETRTRPTALVITAQRACTNLQFRVTVADYEGDYVTYDFYITIVSSPPIAHDPANPSEKSKLGKSGLEGAPIDPSVPESEMKYEPNTYQLFLIPSKDTQVSIDGFNTAKTAKKSQIITVTDLARDIDAGESGKIMLHNGGEFKLKGDLIPLKDGVYQSDCFNIRVIDNKSFEIIATNYNPSEPYELLSFKLADPGNDIPSNALTLYIRIYTVYSNITNPEVATNSYDGEKYMNAEDKYMKYLGGENVVNVMSIEDYNSEEVTDKTSTYAYIRLDGNVGSNGNNSSPIVDPDAQTINAQKYAVNLYAFMDDNGDPLPVTDPTPDDGIEDDNLMSLFDRDVAQGTFRLKNRAAAAKYLIGGRDMSGSSVNPNSRANERLNELKKYIEKFEFSANSTSITFYPNQATLNKKIMLYVEVEKKLGERDMQRNDGVRYAGSLFRLVVEDSAPQAINLAGMTDCNAYFEGGIGDTISFKVFDPADTSGSMFTDMDKEIDKVTLTTFLDPDSQTQKNIDYAKILGDLANDSNFDWNYGVGSNSKLRAFDVSYDVDANILTLKINRRIDVKDEHGNYLEKVTFPLTFEGMDLAGKKCTSVIKVTIKNTPVSATDELDPSDLKADFNQYTNIGYWFTKTGDNTYRIDAQVSINEDLTIYLNDFMIDADNNAQGENNDSFRFVPFSASPYETLCNDLNSESDSDTVTAYYIPDIKYDEEKDGIATISTLTGDTKNSRTGFKIHAISSKRGRDVNDNEIRGIAYLKVIDRAGNIAQDSDEGIIIEISIKIMNAEPKLISEDMRHTSITLVGSKGDYDSDNHPETRSFSIADFVTDGNETDNVGPDSDKYVTYLRIYRALPSPYTRLYSTNEIKPEQLEKDYALSINSDALFDIVTTDRLEQVFEIRPKPGFYGAGSVQIVVTDGDPNSDGEVLRCSFYIDVEVVFNPSEIEQGALNGIETYRGKTSFVTIDSIIKEIPNTLTELDKPATAALSRSETIAPKNAAASFNPSSAFVLVDVDYGPGGEDYYTITPLDNNMWSIRAKNVTPDKKTVKVAYRLKSDPDAEPIYNYFEISIEENTKPELIRNSITFRSNKKDDDTYDPFLLDSYNTVLLSPDMLFKDLEGDDLRFDPTGLKSQMPSLVQVSLEDGMLKITFKGKGQSEISVAVVDETDEPIVRTFVAINNDLPNPPLGVLIAASFEAHKIMWAIIIGSVLLAIIILIIILVVHSKRKHAREELEALLVSEMEIEEQMYKLAGGPSPTGYQSFGYLQSTPGHAVDPGLLLGSGPQTQSVPELALPAPDQTAQTQSQPGGEQSMGIIDDTDGMNNM